MMKVTVWKCLVCMCVCVGVSGWELVSFAAHVPFPALLAPPSLKAGRKTDWDLQLLAVEQKEPLPGLFKGERRKSYLAS